MPMSDAGSAVSPENQDWPAEVARLNKIINALIGRVERAANVEASDFSLFETAVLLEAEVRDRTTELEAALRQNEKITRALRDSEAKFHGVVNQSLVGIAIIERGRFTYTNPRLTEMFGYSAQEAVDLNPLDTVFEEDRPYVAESLRKRLSGEEERGHYVFRGVRKDRTMIDVEVYGSRMEVGGQFVVLSMMMDITERVRIERELQSLQDRLRQESTHDALTGLYNRRFLEEALGRELILADREGHPVSVIMADLDHFKEVNDEYGHAAGDEVLRVFSERLKGLTRGSDISCRWGGEEFLLVLPRMDVSSAAHRAEELRVAMESTPIELEAGPIPVTVSLGVAGRADDGESTGRLIAAADAALYGAKAAGRNRVNVSHAAQLADR
jgi:diguanylate cyclase (GGDEF)-like protein/PAS domain S-box-containing protein